MINSDAHSIVFIEKWTFLIQISPQCSRNESGVLKLFQHTHIGKQKALTSMTKGALLTSLFSSRQNTPTRISLESWSKCYLRKLVKELPFIYIMCVCEGEQGESYLWKRNTRAKTFTFLQQFGFWILKGELFNFLPILLPEHFA